MSKKDKYPQTKEAAIEYYYKPLVEKYPDEFEIKEEEQSFSGVRVILKDKKSELFAVVTEVRTGSTWHSRFSHYAVGVRSEKYFPNNRDQVKLEKIYEKFVEYRKVLASEKASSDKVNSRATFIKKFFGELENTAVSIDYSGNTFKVMGVRFSTPEIGSSTIADLSKMLRWSGSSWAVS